MAYLPGFRNDIFLSYASVDNQPTGSQPGWVDRFLKCLQPELARLMVRFDPPSVWFDVGPGGDAGFADARALVIRDSAIFIAFTSRSYLNSEYCQDDLRVFLQHSEKHGGIVVEGRSRIFNVHLSQDRYAQWPKELESALGYYFYGVTNNPLRPGDRKFESELRRLALDIVNMLEILAQQETGSEPASNAENKPGEIALDIETEKPEADSETEELQRVTESEEPAPEREREELVFVCYAREDEDFALSLAKTVKDHGVRVWVDQWDIPASADWDNSIDEALISCDRFLIVLSPSAVGSIEVRSELQSALDEKKCVVPVLYQQCKIPRRLRLTQHINFISAAVDDETRMGKLLRALKLPK
jgi:hypothetical protein